jgi:hypothetical protein
VKEMRFTLQLTEGISQAEVNKFAFESGIVLNRIEILKKSLETEFLELVKKN